jgi:hypothetical protein
MNSGKMQHTYFQRARAADWNEIMKEQSNQPSKVGQISHDYIGSLFFMFNSLWARRSGGAKEAVMCSTTI